MKKITEIRIKPDKNWKGNYQPEFVDSEGNVYKPTVGYPDAYLAWKKQKTKKSRWNRIVLLNTSIITTEGNFKYKEVSLADVYQNVRAYKEASLEILSAIGHESTAQILSDLLDIEVKVNRIEYKQLPTDNCIVFKLKGRPEEGKVLTKEEVEKIGYTFGLLTMDLPDKKG